MNDTNVKKAIIFGVTGQDGSHLAEFLLDRQYEVVGVARRCSVDTTSRLAKVLANPKFRLAGGDITDAHSCLLYTSPSPRDLSTSRMPSSA